MTRGHVPYASSNSFILQCGFVLLFPRLMSES